MWILDQKVEFTAWKIWILSVNFIYLVSCLPAQPIRPSHLAKFGLQGLLNHTLLTENRGTLALFQGVLAVKRLF